MSEQYDWRGVYNTSHELRCFHLAAMEEETGLGRCLKCDTRIELGQQYTQTERSCGTAKVYIRKLHR